MFLFLAPNSLSLASYWLYFTMRRLTVGTPILSHLGARIIDGSVPFVRKYIAYLTPTMNRLSACLIFPVSFIRTGLVVGVSEATTVTIADIAGFSVKYKGLMDDICITHSALELEKVLKFVSDPSCGAINTFLGTTRDRFDGKRVIRLEYEGYEPMAKKELMKMCQKAREKWRDVFKIAIHHRLGVVEVGQASVVVAVSSEHRKDVFEITAFLIDELKATVPIWKLEVYEGDNRVWKENMEEKRCCGRMVPTDTELVIQKER